MQNFPVLRFLSSPPGISSLPVAPLPATSRPITSLPIASVRIPTALVVVQLLLTCRCRSPARPEFGNFLAHLHHGLLQGRHLGLLYGRRHVIFGPLGGPILVARGRPIVFLTPTVRFLHGPRPENKRTTSRVILLGPIYFVATGKKLLGRHRRDGGGSGGDHRF